MKTATIQSSAAEVIADPAAYLQLLRDGVAVAVPDFDSRAAEALADAVAEEEALEEMVSYRKNVTGVSNTVFISPRGRARHAARIKLAIDPPDSLDPSQGKQASVAVHDGVATGEVSAALLREARTFIELNRAVLLDYWNYKISTDELQRRLRSI
jgi:hypothetical protein